MNQDRALQAWQEWATKVEQLAQRTVEEYLYRLRGLAASIPLLGPVEDVQPALREWLMRLHHDGRSPTDINTSVAAVRCFYRGALALGLCTADASTGLKVARPPRGLPRPLTREELTKLFAVATPLERALAAVYYGAGLRNTEGATLALGDLQYHPAEATIVLRVLGKGRKERVIPLSPPSAALLAEYLLPTWWPEQWNAWYMAEQGDDPVDRWIRTLDSALRAQRYPAAQPVFVVAGRPLTRRETNRIFQRWRKRAGLGEQVKLHRLRHTFATEVLDQDGDLRTVQELLGHADIRQTAAYTGVLVSRKARAVRTIRLPGT